VGSKLCVRVWCPRHMDWNLFISLLVPDTFKYQYSLHWAFVTVIVSSVNCHRIPFPLNALIMEEKKMKAKQLPVHSCLPNFMLSILSQPSSHWLQPILLRILSQFLTEFFTKIIGSTVPSAPEQGWKACSCNFQILVNA